MCSKAKLIKQLGNRCSVCGSKEGLTVHHKFRNKKGISLSNPQKYFEIFCKSCHQKFHTLENLFDSYLQKMSSVKNKKYTNLNRKLINHASLNPNYALELTTKRFIKSINKLKLNKKIGNHFITENKDLIKFFEIFKANNVINV